MLDVSPVGIYIVQDGVFKLVNREFQRRSGYSEAELLNRDSFSLVHPEDREEVRKKNIEMLKGLRLDPYEYRALTKGGETRWIVGAISEIVYQGRRAALGYYLDVTEQRRAEEMERLRKRELEVLTAVARILVQEGDFQQKVRAVLEEMSRVVRLELATLRVPDEEGQSLRLVATIGIASLALGESIPYDQSIPGLAFRQRQSVVLNDYAASPYAREDALRHGVKSAFSLPINVADRTVAVLTFLSREPHHFTPERCHLLSAIAHDLGSLLENARLYQELKDKNRQLEGRVQELKALNQLFQQHLKERFAMEEAYRNLIRHLEQLAQEASALVQEAEAKPLPPIFKEIV